MEAPMGFDIEKHLRYVGSGKCPFVEYKTYCNGMWHHTGSHWATGPYVELRHAELYDHVKDRR